MREVCGAVSAIFMADGLKYGYTSPSDKGAKAEHYKRIQELAAKFKEKYGSIICRDLLGRDADNNPVPSDRTKEYYKKRPCAKQCADAAEILANYIAEHG